MHARTALTIVNFFVLGWALYLAQSIVLPLMYALIIAILLSPAVAWIVKFKVNRIAAIVLVLTLSTLLIAGLGTWLFVQMSHFGESLPLLIDKLQEVFNRVSGWWSGYFQVSPEKMDEYIGNAKEEFLHNSSAFIGSTLTITGKVLAMVVLIPVYVFMILFYRPLLLGFIHKISGAQNELHVSEILTKTKNIIQSYLTGLLIEAAIVATMTSAGLLILGIDYALMLGIMSALLNFIPYLGVFIGSLLSALLALVTGESGWDALYVLLLYGIIQAIDNNYIVPKIVGSKVKINALVSLVAVLAGGLLWGIPGMFLAIPLTAIMKVVFDRIDTLKPYGFLLGDKVPIQKSEIN